MSHHHEHEHHIEAKTTKEKLKILVKHWLEHNNSHIAEYEKWANRCKEENLEEEYNILTLIISKLKELNELYEKLK